MCVSVFDFLFVCCCWFRLIELFDMECCWILVFDCKRVWVYTFVSSSMCVWVCEVWLRYKVTVNLSSRWYETVCVYTRYLLCSWLRVENSFRYTSRLYKKDPIFFYNSCPRIKHLKVYYNTKQKCSKQIPICRVNILQ